MKILIGQSYFRVLDPKELRRNMPYPPLGALYAATILKMMGHEIIFFDAMLSGSPEEFNLAIKKEYADLVIIYDDEFNYLTKMCLSNMRGAAVSFIKTAHELDIPVIIYSSDASDFPLPYLQAGCGAIIYGEGENTLQDVVTSVEKQNFEKDKYSIDGLKFFENENIIKTAQRKLIQELDVLPDPDYSFVDISMYKKIWMENHGYFSMNISTTRGCPYSCNWCAKPLYGRSYTSRSPRAVAEQIAALQSAYSVSHIWMTDDIFGLKTNWISEFSEEIKRRNINVKYKCLSRPDLLLKGNTVMDLKESGCETVWVGAESGSQKILDSMDKGTTVEQIYEASEKIHKAGMSIAFFIQFGYSGEDWNDINLTRMMIKRCLPDDIGISVSYPLPGTVFYQRVKAQMKLKTNWQDSDDLDMMFDGTFNRSFYKLLHRMVHYEYRAVQILRKRNYKKIFFMIYYILRFILLRIRIGRHILNNKSGKRLNINPGLSIAD